MIIGKDNARFEFARGQSVTMTSGTPVTISGTSVTTDTDFPKTNILDGTSEATMNDAAFPGNYARFTQGADSVWAVAIDLASAKSVRFAILAGFMQEDTTNATNSKISSIALESSTDDVTYTPRKTISSSGSSGTDMTNEWNSLTTPSIAFDIGSDVSARYWRLKITASAAGDVRIGYFGLYGDLADAEIFSPTYNMIDRNIYNETISGHRMGVQRTPVKVLDLGLNGDGGTRSMLERRLDVRGNISNDVLGQITAGTIQQNFIDPTVWPNMAILNNTINDLATDSAQVEANLTSFMCVVDRSIQTQYRSLYTNDPVMSLRVREWV